jgi:hypothetical protein
MEDTKQLSDLSTWGRLSRAHLITLEHESSRGAYITMCSVVHGAPNVYVDKRHRT